jgi:D-inositol-3-phosphate glycosyltransferase
VDLGDLRPIIIWVGRFLAVKRVEQLLRAFAHLRRTMTPSPTLVMWGGFPGEHEGPHPAILANELRIRDSIFFAGWRDHDELAYAINCTDLLVSPSVNESFGLVYLEAMACSTPSVATATGGPASIIVDDGPNANGWLVPPNDVRSLARTMRIALTDGAELSRRGANGVRHVRKLYSWSTVVDRYLQVYDETP